MSGTVPASWRVTSETRIWRPDGDRAHTGGGVDGLSRELTILPCHLASVETDSYDERRAARAAVERVERGLDANGTGEGAAGGGEHG